MTKADPLRGRASWLTPPPQFVAHCSGLRPTHKPVAELPPAGDKAKLLSRATIAPRSKAATGSGHTMPQETRSLPAAESTHRRPENSHRSSGGNGQAFAWQPWSERPLRRREAGSTVHTGPTRARSRRDSQPANPEQAVTNARSRETTPSRTEPCGQCSRTKPDQEERCHLPEENSTGCPPEITRG